MGIPANTFTTMMLSAKRIPGGRIANWPFRKSQKKNNLSFTSRCSVATGHLLFLDAG
jgi:hypothetical protein